MTLGISSQIKCIRRGEEEVITNNLGPFDNQDQAPLHTPKCLSHGFSFVNVKFFTDFFQDVIQQKIPTDP